MTDPHLEKAGAPRSAGLLVYRRRHRLEVLIGHMGGPFWARRRDRAYSIPKGGLEAGEEPLDAALREFQEETGIAPPPAPYRDLGEIRQRSGKLVRAFAVEADLDVTGFSPGTAEMVWHGRSITVPELDRLEWVPLEEAAGLLIAAQAAFLDRLS